MQLLDNTVLSNFALVEQLALIPIALEGQVATTSQVMAEYNNGVTKGILPPNQLEWLQIINLNTEETELFAMYCDRVNAGEASCLAVASLRNGRLLTDDRDARKLAAQLQIPVSGTLGILLRLVHLKQIAIGTANTLLGQMIQKGYRSPISTLNHLLDQ